MTSRDPLSHVIKRDPLQGLAYLAATSFYTSRSIELPDRVQVAYIAILTATQAGYTDRGTLLRKANIALTRQYRKDRNFRGQRQQQPGMHPNAVKYWTGNPTPFTDQIIERIAVHQVLDALPTRHRTILTDAARGIRPKYARELQQARQAAWALWHDWETPQGYLYHSQGRKSEHLS